jgi:hypothetical protein
MINEAILLLGKYRFSLTTEAALKDEMVRVFMDHKLVFEREKPLDKKNRPDFFIDGYAIEVKIGGRYVGRQSAVSIFKQCERYASFDEVKGVVLVSNRAMGFPETIHGKPAYFVSLGKGWL